MFSQFQGQKEGQRVSQSSLQNSVKEDLNSALGPLLQKYVNQIEENERVEFLNHIQELFIQKILIQDACAQQDNKSIEEQITQRKKSLTEKWESRDDTEERRKILGLCGVQSNLLYSGFSSILIDNFKDFKKSWKDNEQDWKNMLFINCLIGSKEIGSFILENKSAMLLEKDYEELLACIALSSNEGWTCEFAEKMRKMNYKFPNSLYNHNDIDLELIDKVQEVFENQSSKISVKNDVR